jgi:hypothetical protein
LAIVDGEPIHDTLLAHPRLPFKTWHAHSISKILRSGDLAEFIRYSCVSDDSAGMLLIKQAKRLVELISFAPKAGTGRSRRFCSQDQRHAGIHCPAAKKNERRKQKQRNLTAGDRLKATTY